MLCKNTSLRVARQLATLPPDTILVFLDTETTGVRSNDEIVQFSAQKVSLDGKFVSEFSTYVRPSIPMPEEASAVNGLTNEFLSSQPPMSDVFPKIRDYIGAHPVICAYNAPFDVRMLQSAYARMGCSLDDTRTIDVLQQAREVLDLQQYKLNCVCSALNVASEAHFHDAMEDVRATVSAFFALKKLGEEALKELERTRFVPRVMSVWFWGGYNHKQARVYAQTSAGKVYYSLFRYSWESKEVDLNRVDVHGLERNVWSFLGAKTEKDFIALAKSTRQ